MNEIRSRLNNQLTKMNPGEVNNNSPRKNRKVSQVSISSATSYHSDSSEDSQATLDRQTSLQEMQKVEDKKLRSEFKKQRSMSDGSVKLQNDENNFEVFPSLPNSVLEKMGLRGDSPRVRLSEEELEEKFTSLALAFTIDATTVKDRFGRQRRYRDQTETNLAMEIERLKEKLALIQPLCTDYETAELLSTLLTQVDIVMKATSLVSISAEKFGSVQHEDRLAESVNLMVNHVQMLKQQRDSTRRQLQYTKRVLQNSSDSPSSSPTNLLKPSLSPPNRKLISQRRASIAILPQSLMVENKVVDAKKVMRRTSDLTLRASSLNRSVRPSRLELIGDLVKIKEGFVDELSTKCDDHSEENYSDNDILTESNSNNSIISSPEEIPKIEFTHLSLREKIKSKFRKISNGVENKYQKWTDDGTIHEVCCFCALLCFSISLLIMVNIIVEYEYAKRGLGKSHIFWSSTEDYSENR